MFIITNAQKKEVGVSSRIKVICTTKIFQMAMQFNFILSYCKAKYYVPFKGSNSIHTIKF